MHSLARAEAVTCILWAETAGRPECRFQLLDRLFIGLSVGLRRMWRSPADCAERVRAAELGGRGCNVVPAMVSATVARGW